MEVYCETILLLLVSWFSILAFSFDVSWMGWERQYMLAMTVWAPSEVLA